MTNNQVTKSEVVKQLVESGKYDEVAMALRAQLCQSGWVADLRARVAEVLSKNGTGKDDLQELKFSSIANQLDLNELYNSRIDPEVKQMVVRQLAEFLREHFDLS